jgi:hypothetical protein
MTDPVLFGRIAIALARSAGIGLEREPRHKSAGGTGLIAVATGATLASFVIAVGFRSVMRRAPRSPWAPLEIGVQYVDHHGVLRDVPAELTQRGETSELASTIAEIEGAVAVDAGDDDHD